MSDRWEDKPNRHAYCDAEITRLRAGLENQVARGDRLEGQNGELRAAAEHFAETWSELLITLPDSYACHLSCAEANAAAALYQALGDEDTGLAIVDAHAAHDGPGDDHYRAAIASAGTEHLAQEQA